MTGGLRELWAERLHRDGFVGLNYADLLGTGGVEVVEEHEFGTYSGDLVMLVRDAGGRLGVLVVAYGSCPVCDALEAAAPDMFSESPDLTDLLALRDQLVASAMWPADGLSVTSQVEAKADGNVGWVMRKALPTVARLAAAADAAAGSAS